MNNIKTFPLLLLIFYNSCSTPINTLKDRNKIAVTEQAFEKMAEEKGLAEAFYFYADMNAVIKRENDSLIYGRESIFKYYISKLSNKKTTLKWKPDFIEVAQNGDLAYTFGKYFYCITDSAGKKTTYKGAFHTVWKKQPDGTWRYVWD